ncbi:hypothetical protein [Hallerella porci]|nr:hypothetical protein [Hallerella porci]
MISLNRFIPSNIRFFFIQKSQLDRTLNCFAGIEPESNSPSKETSASCSP